MNRTYFKTVALMAITALLAVSLPACKGTNQPEVPSPKLPISLGTIGTTPTTPSTPATPPTPPTPAVTLDFTAEGVAFKLVRVAAVTDATLGHADRANNKPHTVSLSAYYMGETEVTQELYKAVLTGDAETNAEPSSHSDSPAAGEEQAKRPVEKISWFDAVYFCNALTKKVMGAADCVYTITAITRDATTKSITAATVTADWSKKGFRLPTEAEWEYAAMGGNTTNRWAGTDEEAQLGNYAWFYTNSGNETHEVKKLKANGYNLYDMSGNVIELCWDWYGGAIAENANLGQDPTGAETGTEKISRGGSWCSDNAVCMCVYRGNTIRSNSILSDLGMRMVCRP